MKKDNLHLRLVHNPKTSHKTPKTTEPKRTGRVQISLLKKLEPKTDSKIQDNNIAKRNASSVHFAGTTDQDQQDPLGSHAANRQPTTAADINRDDWRERLGSTETASTPETASTSSQWHYGAFGDGTLRPFLPRVCECVCVCVCVAHMGSPLFPTGIRGQKAPALLCGLCTPRLPELIIRQFFVQLLVRWWYVDARRVTAD